MKNQRPILAVHELYSNLGEAAVLRGVSLEVGRGEVVAVMGPSGGGKTTLLRAVNYLTPFQRGSIEVAGHKLRPGLCERKDAVLLRQVRLAAGMVFQHFNLFPHFTVLENLIEAPHLVRQQPPSEVTEQAHQLLERVGLQEQTDLLPRMLSGGQQQRVAIARALMMQPKVLLLDEPTSALDPQLAGEVLSVIHDLAVHGQTMVVVTHDIRFARHVASRILILAGGVVVESGPPEQVLERPQHAATQALLRSGV